MYSMAFNLHSREEGDELTKIVCISKCSTYENGFEFLFAKVFAKSLSLWPSKNSSAKHNCEKSCTDDQ